MPRGPVQAKGLLLASIRDKNAVVFLEPKVLYRAGVGDVPEGDYELPLEQADIVRRGERSAGALAHTTHAAAAVRLVVHYYRSTQQRKATYSQC